MTRKSLGRFVFGAEGGIAVTFPCKVRKDGRQRAGRRPQRYWPEARGKRLIRFGEEPNRDGAVESHSCKMRKDGHPL